MEDGKVIRLLGIDSHEIGESCYEKAKEKLNSFVDGKEIRVESDSTDRDYYGRILRYVFVGDLFISVEMIRLGYAKFYELGNNEKYSELFLEMEDKARKAKRCIWN